jgi:hypothetical protein
MPPLILAATATLIIGFLAGLFLFKLKQHWCPKCGNQLRCLHCLHHAGWIPQQPTGNHAHPTD